MDPNNKKFIKELKKANKEEDPLAAQRESAPTIFAPCIAAINLHAKSPFSLLKRASIESRTNFPNKFSNH